MKKEKAAITVFLIIVLFTTTLLGGLFIDAGRILLAKRAVRNAADSAARSALSYYDVHLASEYGLFAVDQTEAQEAFSRYFQANLKLSQNDGFNILQMRIPENGISVSASSPITDNGVLLDSMEEYSKYRVVVNTSIGVVEKIKNIFSSGGASQKTFNAADTGKSAMEQLKSDAEELYNSARDLISSTMKTQTDRIKGTVQNMFSTGRTEPPTDAELGFDEIDAQFDNAQNESNQIADSCKEYEDISKAQSDSLEGTTTSSKYWDEESGSWKTENGSAANSGEDDGQRSDIPTISEEAMDAKNEIDQEISAARAHYEEVKNQIRSKSAKAAEYNLEIEKLTATLDIQEAAVKDLQQAYNQLEEKKKADPYNYIFTNTTPPGLQVLKDNYDDLAAQLQQLRKDEAPQIQIQAKQQELERAAEALEAYVSGMEEKPKTIYDDELKKKKDELDTAKKAVETTKAALEKAKKERDRLVQEIQALYDTIAVESKGDKELTVPDSISGEDKEKVSSNAVSFISDMVSTYNKLERELGKTASDVDSSNGFEAFAFSLESALDDVWKTIEDMGQMGEGLVTLVTDPAQAGPAMLFTDYVFGNFTFLTTQTMRDNRHFQVAEIEYILQGSDSQAKCVTDTIFDIAMLRLLINWVDYMTTTHSPEIISRMLIALGRAGIRTVKDMASMVFTIDKDETATCALSPSFSKVRLSYSDHLRLAMMLRAIGSSGRSEMLGRVKTMMEDTYEVQNWGAMSSRMTRVKADVTVEVDLLMVTLPMFEAVLPEDNQILQDGKFLVHETVEMGY